MDTKNVKWYVHKPLDWEYPIGEERCCYGVYDTFLLRHRQCLFKSKVEVDGYGFCTRHAKIVNEGLNNE